MASVLCLSLARQGGATPAEPGNVQADLAPCLAAAQAGDDDRAVEICGRLIDSEKAERPDRIKALIARAAAYARKDMIDRAIEDYGGALRLDPSLADTFNARGELWRRRGDYAKAVLDFDAAIRLNPDHAAARANHKSLALELERLGAQKAVAGKPGFDCGKARHAVQKAICANPELADLDREIVVTNDKAMREAENPRTRRALQREQDEFIAHRNAGFGRPGYDLRKAMKERLERLTGADRY